MNAVSQQTPMFGYAPMRVQMPMRSSSETASKYQLSFHSSSGPGWWWPSSRDWGRSAGGRPDPGRDRRPSASRSSTCWAYRARVVRNISSPRSVRSTGNGGGAGQEDPKKALPAVARPALLPIEVPAAVGLERLEVLAHERLLVRAPVLDRERTAEEVRRVGHHRAPADRLPVDR